MLFCLANLCYNRFMSKKQIGIKSVKSLSDVITIFNDLGGIPVLSLQAITKKDRSTLNNTTYECITDDEWERLILD